MSRTTTVTLASNGAYWQAQYYDGGGRKRAKSLGAKSKMSRRQAKILCDRLAAELLVDPSKADRRVAPTLEQYLTRYLESRTDLKPATRYLHDLTARYLKQFFDPNLRIDRISRAAASEWRVALARGELKDARSNHQYQAMNETSVCRRAADAKVIFAHAVRDDLIPFNPFDRVRSRAPEPEKDWHYVDLPSLEKLLTACPTSGWRALVALCRLAGLRRGEAMALPWSAVDWDRRMLTVLAGKTGRRRHVPVEPRLHTVLQEAFDAAPDGQAQMCDDVSPHCLWRNFCVIRKKAGLPAWDDAFQVMRRNAETDWAQRFPQYAVSCWIGHDITVSATHYLQVPRELFDRVSRVVESDASSTSDVTERAATARGASG